MQTWVGGILMREVPWGIGAMKILVCGSRSWQDKEAIRDYLVRHGATCVVEGAARGADNLAHEVATELGIENRRYPADWNTHGKAAGFIRNQQMLDQERPDLVLAFWDGETSHGTQDMVRRATAAEVEVTVVTVHPIACSDALCQVCYGQVIPNSTLCTLT